MAPSVSVELVEVTQPDRVLDEEMVGGGVEEIGEFHDGFDRGRDLAVLVATDLAGIAVDLEAELPR